METAKGEDLANLLNRLQETNDDPTATMLDLTGAYHRYINHPDDDQEGKEKLRLEWVSSILISGRRIK